MERESVMIENLTEKNEVNLIIELMAKLLIEDIIEVDKNQCS